MSAPSSRSRPSNSSSRRLLPIPASASLAQKTQVQAQEIEKLHLLLDTVRDLGTELSLDLLEAHGAEEISLGDYVLSGGEMAALTLLDACVRLLPGVIGNDQAVGEESFGISSKYGRLLE